MDLTGKWKYQEKYGIFEDEDGNECFYGTAIGELFLTQKGEELSGKIVFMDHPGDEQPYMLQEFIEGRIEGDHIIIDAIEMDLIHSDEDIYYELDHWHGTLLNNNLIAGISCDDQDVEGQFSFERIS